MEAAELFSVKAYLYGYLQCGRHMIKSCLSNPTYAPVECSKQLTDCKTVCGCLACDPFLRGIRPSSWGKGVSTVMRTVEICISTELTHIERAAGRCQGQRQHVHGTALHPLLIFVFCL